MATNEIAKAYQDLFGRSATQADLDYWSSTDKTGADLTKALTGAASGTDRTAIVSKNYKDLFGREAEQAGTDFWTSDDSWNKYASGGLDSLRLQMGGGSRADDEFALMDRLKEAGGSGWSSTFFDKNNADAVWKALLDDEGFNAKTGQPDLSKLLELLKGQQPSAGGGGGGFGGYKDYFNNYLDDVLDVGIRKIGEQGDIARNRLGSQAFSAGAYGDARHGVESDNLTQSLLESIGDLTASTKAQGFESAMGWANRDLDRQANIAYQNAMLQNNWMQNQISGANTANNVGLNDYATNVNWLGFLQGLDQYDRNWNQQDLNTNYQDWWAEQNWDQNQLVALLNVLNAIPGQQTNISTQAEPENSWASLLGSQLSGAFGGSGSGWSAPSWI